MLVITVNLFLKPSHTFYLLKLYYISPKFFSVVAKFVSVATIFLVSIFIYSLTNTTHHDSSQEGRH